MVAFFILSIFVGIITISGDSLFGNTIGWESL
jgi:hypothetical protein